MDHPLDNPVWHALTGPHAALAVGDAPLLHYPPDVSPFAAFADGRPPSDLAERLPPGVAIASILPEPLAPPPGMTVAGVLPVLQMVATEVPHVDAPAPIEPLTPDDADAMLALTDLTKPGPFARQTIRMGTYLGIKQDGVLAAMTGERLHLPAFQEVSAVCTHPDHLGRGYARMLVARVARAMLARGKTPFLHVVPENAAAIAVYRKLGFATRRTMTATFLRRA